VTTFAATEPVVSESAISSDDEFTSSAAHAGARALPRVTARLRERHPTVPATVIERHVNAAIALLSREARIHDYLPILIERTAAASLARLLA